MEEAPVQVRGEEGLAVLIECQIDSWVLVEVGAAPNGDDAIVNDEMLAYRNRVWLRLVEDSWKIESGEEIERWVAAESCPE